jgi:hypothetical protein
MAKIEKAAPDMFEDVCELFVDELPPKERVKAVDKFYRPIFSYKWRREEEHCGYVLVDKGKIVGFVGSFFVQRHINGKMERFANLTAWKVRKESRNESILLLMQFFGQKELTITGRTAPREIFAIQEKLGFKNLDSTMKIVPTFIGVPERNSGCSHFSEAKDLDNRLNDMDLQLYQDHKMYKCKHMLIQRRDRYCYIVCSFVKKWHSRMAHVHYISDLTVFLESLTSLKTRLLLNHGIQFLCIEERFLRGRKVPFALNYQSPFTHIYKSNVLAREDIDNLYTELIIFNTFENRFY